MTLIYEFNLHILNMYPYAKMKFLGQGFHKLEHNRTDRQTHVHTDATVSNTTPHSRAVIKITIRTTRCTYGGGGGSGAGTTIGAGGYTVCSTAALQQHCSHSITCLDFCRNANSVTCHVTLTVRV